MAEAMTIKRIRGRLSEHPIEVETAAQIAERLRKIGYGPRTATNMAEITLGTLRAIRTGQMVGTERGE